MTDDRIAALLTAAAVPDASAAREATVAAALTATGLVGRGGQRDEVAVQAGGRDGAQGALRAGVGTPLRSGSRGSTGAGSSAPVPTGAGDAECDGGLRSGQAGRRQGGRRGRAGRRRRSPLPVRRAWTVAALATALAVAAAFSPPGRAALAGAADLIGKIGGAPASDDDRGLESTVKPGRPGSPVVVAAGRAPDGSRYEWVAFRRTEPGGPPLPDRARGGLDTFCVTFAWVGEPARRGTGGCSTLGGTSTPDLPGRDPLVWLSGRLTRPRSAGGGGDYLMLGHVRPRVARVRILYRRPNGERVDVPVSLGRVRGELLRRAGGERPFTVLTAFIPRALVRADRLGKRYRPMALSVVAPDYRVGPPSSRRYRRCVARHGGLYERGWIDVFAYDRAGRQIDALRTRTVRRGLDDCDRFRALPPPKRSRTFAPAENPPPEPPPPLRSGG